MPGDNGWHCPRRRDQEGGFKDLTLQQHRPTKDSDVCNQVCQEIRPSKFLTSLLFAESKDVSNQSHLISLFATKKKSRRRRTTEDGWYADFEEDKQPLIRAVLPATRVLSMVFI